MTRAAAPLVLWVCLAAIVAATGLAQDGAPGANFPDNAPDAVAPQSSALGENSPAPSDDDDDEDAARDANEPDADADDGEPQPVDPADDEAVPPPPDTTNPTPPLPDNRYSPDLSNAPRIDVDDRPAEWTFPLVDLETANPLYAVDSALAWLDNFFQGALTDLATALGTAPEGVERPFSLGVHFFHRFETLTSHDFEIDPAQTPSTLSDIVPVERHYVGNGSRWRLAFTANTPDFQFVTELQQAQYLGGGPTSPIGRSDAEDVWDFSRLYVQIFGAGGEAFRVPVGDSFWRFAAHVGRAPIRLGRGRLLGSNPFILRGDAFDSALIAAQDENTGIGITAFGARSVRYERLHVNEAEFEWFFSGLLISGLSPFDSASPERGLAWDRPMLHAGRDRAWFEEFVPGALLSDEMQGLDLLFLWEYRNRDNIVGETGAIGNIDRRIVSARFGIEPLEAFGLETEVVYQFGHRGRDRVSAWAVHAEFVGSVLAGRVPIALAVLVDFAQGDGTLGDGTTHTFDDLRPDLHGRFGFQDLIAWRNLIHVGARARVRFAPTVMLSTAVHLLWSHTTEDAVYAPQSRRLVAAGAGGPDSAIGVVVDAALHYHYSERVAIDLGISVFSPGSRLRAVGLRETPTMLFVQLALGFGGP